jgi:hypothetical protein
VPLSSIQADILRILAAGRAPDSYVAGATLLNRDGPRVSRDIDVFQDREERVADAAAADAAALRSAGYDLIWLQRQPALYSAEVRKGAEATRLDWAADSDFRFFPTLQDETYGFVLHPIDLAMNKVMAAAGRREVRDIVDLLTVHETILPLGALVWAVVEKSPGFTPEGLIAEIRRNLHHPKAEWNSLASTHPIDPVDVVARVRSALDEAEAFVTRMPTEKIGLLFIHDGAVVQPDPDRLADYETHAGQRRGHWPSNPQIAEMLLERYQQQE